MCSLSTSKHAWLILCICKIYLSHRAHTIPNKLECAQERADWVILFLISWKLEPKKWNMNLEFDHPKNANCFACRAVLEWAKYRQKKRYIQLILGFGSKLLDCGAIKWTLSILYNDQGSQKLHRWHYWWEFCNSKLICICILDVLTYFG